MLTVKNKNKSQLYNRQKDKDKEEKVIFSSKDFSITIKDKESSNKTFKTNKK